MTLSSASAGGAGGPAVTAPPTQVLAATPATVAKVFGTAGYRVTVSPASGNEDLSFTLVAGKYELGMWFSGCAGQGIDDACLRVTASIYDGPDAVKLTVEDVNRWNTHHYTHAYVLEDNTYVDSSFILRGGYTKAALLAWMQAYLDDLGDFEEEFFK
ncbi:YbjN domain-containing protein [Deinococcus hopiensis]|uniref:YbjN domain-containing protein n=1 Tax=Deinococcus hopiensis TaxID=309885 RepID=UPI001FE8FD9C|nr:YbjN domain-containing protein [Deinococcus hopiensis]